MPQLPTPRTVAPHLPLLTAVLGVGSPASCSQVGACSSYASLAYRLAPRMWGAGYATEVSRVALARAREHLPHVPVVALIHQENAPSIRVAERLGVRLDRVIPYEGTAHRVYVAG